MSNFKYNSQQKNILYTMDIDAKTPNVHPISLLKARV